VPSSRRKKTRVLQLRLDPEMLAGLELVAEERGQAVAQLLRSLAAQAIDPPRVSSFDRLILRELSELRVLTMALIAEAKGTDNANRILKAARDKAEERVLDLLVELRGKERQR